MNHKEEHRPETQTAKSQDWSHITGFISTKVDTPSYTPRGAFEQFVILTNGGSSRAYLYDTNAKAWRNVALT